VRTTKRCKRCYDKNFLKECACGCGYIITDRDSNSRLRTFRHGHPTRPFHHSAGEQHYNWKGGRWLISKGYVHISTGHHRHKPEHIIVMEKHIGRGLLRGELVHHINGIKSDNRIENLQLVSHSDHMRIHHHKGESRAEFWNKYQILRDVKTGRILSIIPK